MRISILGTGRMALSLGGALQRAGHEVFFGSRSSERARDVAASLAPGASGGLYAEAVAWCEVGALASLWQDIPAVLTRAGPWRGKILLDCSNPEAADSRSHEIGHTTSGAEKIAAWAGDARVVKAFNHVYAEVLDGAAAFGSERPSAFLCGDDASARQTVSDLVEQSGLDPVDCGPLTSARWLEPMAALMVELVRVRGMPPGGIALKLLKTA